MSCRRAAEGERQRVVRCLERLEVERMELAHTVRRGGGLRIAFRGLCLKPEERLADVESDIAALRSRLRELLAEPEGAT